MRSALLLTLLSLVGLPSLSLPADFEAVAKGAQRVDALEAFLSHYVGHCTDVYEKVRCEANVAQVRRQATGQTFTVRISDAAALVRAERKGGAYLILLTPFVDGGGIALTNGAPVKQDPVGHPLINLIPIPGSVPEGMMDLEYESPFRTGAIELEIVFRPERVWKLDRRGEKGSYEGVAAHFLAVRVIDARSGNALASRVL